MKAKLILKLSMILIGIALFAGCQSTVRFSSDNSGTKNVSATKIDYSGLPAARQNVLREAENWVGTPYCFGGDTKNCIDCSGFVKKIYESAGIDLPRTSSEQYDFSRHISENNRKPGDLVFFKNKKQVNHVGIFIGGNEFVHSSTSQGVVISSLNDSYFKDKIAGFGRVLN